MREREIESRHKVYTQAKNILINGERLNYIQGERRVLYIVLSHPLSSRHINVGNEEGHKLCVIEYDSMIHTKCSTW